MTILWGSALFLANYYKTKPSDKNVDSGLTEKLIIVQFWPLSLLRNASVSQSVISIKLIIYVEKNKNKR